MNTPTRDATTGSTDARTEAFPFSRPVRPYVYTRIEPDIPYFYTRAAFIDTVKYSSAYSVPENSVPAYITGKGWSSLNPTLNVDKTVGITWNGGCSYNHDMTVGGITYRYCLDNLPLYR